MVPKSIKNNLASLRMRERLLTFAWGTACWLSITLVLLFVCGLVDWLIDRYRDTPMPVRLGLLVIQAAVASVAALVFMLWPQIRRLPDSLLALWVEAKLPQFQHRLISAVQLNQPRAKLDGMSKELVGIVTKEAEKLTERAGGFAKVADHSRLKWSGGLLLPIVVLVVLPFALWPEVSFALLARQALLPTEVPHSVHLESISAEVWPVGDKIKIAYRVTGDYTDTMVGTLHVRPEGEAGDDYDLTYYGEDAKGAIFMAEVSPSATNLVYSARLADGRTRHPSEMRLVHRPAIMENQAWVRLPAYCGLRPDGRRYEVEGRGDLSGIPGSAVKVQFEVASLQHQAWLTLLETDGDSLDAAKDQPSSERERPEKIKMDVHAGVKSKMVDGVWKPVDTIIAETTFDLTPGLAGYRLFVKDENGFENSVPPRRNLQLTPEEPPTVRLLHDSFTDIAKLADFDVEGLPVILGGKIRIPYECSHKYGLGRARIWYRVLKKQTSGENPEAEVEWTRANLVDEPANPDAGSFNAKTGVFERTRFDKEVQFHAVPSPVPDLFLGRTQGGGRVFLPTNGLVDAAYKPMKVKYGDMIEYCIEVFANDHDRLRGSVAPSARSETRVSEVVSVDGFMTWYNRVTRVDQNVKDLEKKQKDALGQTK